MSQYHPHGDLVVLTGGEAGLTCVTRCAALREAQLDPGDQPPADRNWPAGGKRDPRARPEFSAGNGESRRDSERSDLPGVGVGAARLLGRSRRLGVALAAGVAAEVGEACARRTAKTNVTILGTP